MATNNEKPLNASQHKTLVLKIYGEDAKKRDFIASLAVGKLTVFFRKLELEDVSDSDSTLKFQDPSFGVRLELEVHNALEVLTR